MRLMAVEKPCTHTLCSSSISYFHRCITLTLAIALKITLTFAYALALILSPHTHTRIYTYICGCSHRCNGPCPRTCPMRLSRTHGLFTHGVCMQDGNTPLLLASDNGHRETVEVLLAHKADVNAKSKVNRAMSARVRLWGLGDHGTVWGQGSAMP